MERAQLLAEAQHLVGAALSAYHNDRSASRADAVIPALERAFNILVTLREKYSATTRKRKFP